VKGRELESQDRVLDGYGLVIAHEQPNDRKIHNRMGGMCPIVPRHPALSQQLTSGPDNGER